MGDGAGRVGDGAGGDVAGLVGWPGSQASQDSRLLHQTQELPAKEVNSYWKEYEAPAFLLDAHVW